MSTVRETVNKYKDTTRERGRHGEIWGERHRERQRETPIDAHRYTDRETYRHRETGRERERQRQRERDDERKTGTET